jgi:hypothetical protein
LLTNMSGKILKKGLTVTGGLLYYFFVFENRYVDMSQ